MRLVAQLYATVPSNVVSRDPSLFEKMKRRMGGRVNLTTDEVENQLEATAIIDAVKRRWSAWASGTRCRWSSTTR